MHGLYALSLFEAVNNVDGGPDSNSSANLINVGLGVGLGDEEINFAT